MEDVSGLGGNLISTCQANHKVEGPVTLPNLGGYICETEIQAQNSVGFHHHIRQLHKAALEAENLE